MSSNLRVYNIFQIKICFIKYQQNFRCDSRQSILKTWSLFSLKSQYTIYIVVYSTICIDISSYLLFINHFSARDKVPSYFYFRRSYNFVPCGVLWLHFSSLTLQTFQAHTCEVDDCRRWWHHVGDTILRLPASFLRVLSFNDFQNWVLDSNFFRECHRRQPSSLGWKACRHTGDSCVQFSQKNVTLCKRWPTDKSRIFVNLWWTTQYRITRNFFFLHNSHNWNWFLLHTKLKKIAKNGTFNQNLCAGWPKYDSYISMVLSCRPFLCVT